MPAYSETFKKKSPGDLGDEDDDTTPENDE
jgi:hypothetical protein